MRLLYLRFFCAVAYSVSLSSSVLAAPKAPIQKAIKKPLPLEEQLQVAITKENYPVAKSLLQRGVDTKKLKDISSLWALVLFNNEKDGKFFPDKTFIEWMLKKGVRWDAKSIHLVLSLELPPIFDLFLANGVKINGNYQFFRSESSTPLMSYVAGFGSDPDFLRYLIKCGADVNVTTKKGVTILQLVADTNRENEIQLIKIVLEAGAKAKPTDSGVIECALQASDAQLLSQALALGIKLPKYISPFKTLCSLETDVGDAQLILSEKLIKSRVECAKLLIKAGISVNQNDDEGSSPLMYAVTNGLQSDLVELLLKNGANPSPKSKESTIWDSASPLPFQKAWQLAQKPTNEISPAELVERKARISEESTRTLELLLDAKVPIDLPNASGETILMMCAGVNRTKSVKLLIARGAKLELRDSRGETALQKAVLSNSPDAAKVLIDVKANIETTDYKGSTPLMNSLDFSGANDVFFLLLNSGANVNARNKHGSTPLLQAFFSSGDNSYAIKQLLKKGANPNVQQNSGETPLVMAIVRGDVNMARQLIKVGANTNILFQKKTLLQWARIPSYAEIQLAEFAKSPQHKKQALIALEAHKKRRRELIQLLTPKQHTIKDKP